MPMTMTRDPRIEGIEDSAVLLSMHEGNDVYVSMMFHMEISAVKLPM